METHEYKGVINFNNKSEIKCGDKDGRLFRNEIRYIDRIITPYHILKTHLNQYGCGIEVRDRWEDEMI